MPVVQRLTPLNSPYSSQPSSPHLSAVPQHSLPAIASLNNSEVHVPQRRLLVPTVRRTRVAHSRTHKVKTGRLTRPARSSSLGAELGPNRESKDWVSALGKMHIVEEQLELRGYQMYAVEKWCVASVASVEDGSSSPPILRVVDRGRLVNVVSVYTGDPRHKAAIHGLRNDLSLMREPLRSPSRFLHPSSPCQMCRHKQSLTTPFTFFVETVHDHERYISPCC